MVETQGSGRLLSDMKVSEVQPLATILRACECSSWLGALAALCLPKELEAVLTVVTAGEVCVEKDPKCARHG